MDKKIDKRLDTLLEDAFKESLKRISENNLSIEEVALNVDADPRLVHVILTNPKVVETVSNIMLFTQVRVKHRVNNFYPYSVFDGGTVFKVRRNIKPICSVYYSRARQEFYNFWEKIDGSISKNTKGIYLKEMMDVLEKYIEK